MKTKHANLLSLFLFQIFYTLLILFVLYPVNAWIQSMLSGAAGLLWKGTGIVFSAFFFLFEIRLAICFLTSDRKLPAEEAFQTALSFSLHQKPSHLLLFILYAGVFLPFVPGGWLNSAAGFYEMPAFCQKLLLGREEIWLWQMLLTAAGFLLNTLLLFLPVLLVQTQSFSAAVFRSPVSWKRRWPALLTSAGIFLLWLLLRQNAAPLLGPYDFTFTLPNYLYASPIFRYELAETLLTRFLFLALEDFLILLQLSLLPKEEQNETVSASFHSAWHPIRLILLLVLAAAGYFLTPAVFLENSSLLIIGHKGGGSSIGNTLKSIVQGQKSGAEIAEVDVQATEDGQLVLFHDDTFEKLAGKDTAIASMTWPEVHQTVLKKGKKTGEVPLLSAALQEAARIGQPLLLDLKPGCLDAADYLQMITEEVEAAGMKDMVYLQAEDLAMLEEMKTLDNGWKTGYLQTGAFGPALNLEDSDFTDVRYTTLTPSFLETCRSNGTAVFVWTVNEEKEIEALIPTGISGIVSDHPALVKTILDESSR